MNTTIESTVTAAELHALLGARAQPVIDACNGVQWKPDDAQARTVRSARIDAAIAAALAAYTNEGMHNAVSTWRLAGLLRDRITAGIALGKAGGEVPDAFKNGLKKSPCQRTIFKRLKNKL